jgi:hypothetical protein
LHKKNINPPITDFHLKKEENGKKRRKRNKRKINKRRKKMWVCRPTMQAQQTDLGRPPRPTA